METRISELGQGDRSTLRSSCGKEGITKRFRTVSKDIGRKLQQHSEQTHVSSWLRDGELTRCKFILDPYSKLATHTQERLVFTPELLVTSQWLGEELGQLVFLGLFPFLCQPTDTDLLNKNKTAHQPGMGLMRWRKRGTSVPLFRLSREMDGYSVSKYRYLA